jgi:hypothetical protein
MEYKFENNMWNSFTVPITPYSYANGFVDISSNDSSVKNFLQGITDEPDVYTLKNKIDVVWGRSNNSFSWISYNPRLQSLYDIVDDTNNSSFITSSDPDEPYLKTISPTKGYYIRTNGDSYSNDSIYYPKFIEGIRPSRELHLKAGWNMFTSFDRNIPIGDIITKINDANASLDVVWMQRKDNSWISYNATHTDVQDLMTVGKFGYVKVANDVDITFDLDIPEDKNTTFITIDPNIQSVELYVKNIKTDDDDSNDPLGIQLVGYNDTNESDILISATIPGEYAGENWVQLKLNMLDDNNETYIKVLDFDLTATAPGDTLMYPFGTGMDISIPLMKLSQPVKVRYSYYDEQYSFNDLFKHRWIFATFNNNDDKHFSYDKIEVIDGSEFSITSFDYNFDENSWQQEENMTASIDYIDDTYMELNAITQIGEVVKLSIVDTKAIYDINGIPLTADPINLDSNTSVVLETMVKGEIIQQADDSNVTFELNGMKFTEDIDEDGNITANDLSLLYSCSADEDSNNTFEYDGIRFTFNSDDNNITRRNCPEGESSCSPDGQIGEYIYDDESKILKIDLSSDYNKRIFIKIADDNETVLTGDLDNVGQTWEDKWYSMPTVDDDNATQYNLGNLVEVYLSRQAEPLPPVEDPQ